jgi:hypothetical protein
MLFRLILIGLGIYALRQLFSGRGQAGRAGGQVRRRAAQATGAEGPHGIRNPMFYVERPHDMKAEILASAR